MASRVQSKLTNFVSECLSSAVFENEAESDQLGQASLTFFSARLRVFAMLIFCLIVAELLLNGKAIAKGAEQTAELTSFTVSEFVVDGKNPLSNSQTNRILDPFRRSLTIETLREAATELEKALATKGYNFYRATLPPQRLADGVVRVEIKRLDIAEVIVTGNDYFSSENIQRSLPLVARRKSPNTQKIASALLLAEDNPAKEVRVVFAKGADPQTVDANITVTDQNPNELFVWANNAGSALTSRSRLGAQYHNRNLWGRDHQLAFSVAISPENTSELTQFGLNYRIPIYTTRGMANFLYSKSNADTGRVADVFDISGAGESIGFGYTQYLDLRGDYQHRVGFEVSDKLFDSDVLFESQDIGNDVRTRPLTISYIGRLDRNNWLINSQLSHSSNLSGGSFNDDQSYGLVRGGADSSWNKQNISFRFDYRWNREWRGKVLLFAQSTSDLLVPGEKFGLGGALGDFGPRGFFEREVVVDEGVKGTFEINRSFTTKRIQLGMFYDWATGDQINAQAGESDDESLASVGVTFKWNIRPDLSIDIDYGYVIDGIDQEFSDGTDDGDSRLHLAVRYFPQWPFSKRGS